MASSSNGTAGSPSALAAAPSSAVEPPSPGVAVGAAPSPSASPSPSGMQARAPRAPLIHAVMCRFAGEPDFVKVTTLNISQSGMLVEGHTLSPPRSGTFVDFKFFLETGFEILGGVGTVVRQGPPSAKGPTVGIAFGALDPARQRILARVVELNSAADDASDS